MKNLLTEMIGTFFLVLTVGLCVVGQVPLAPLFIGSSLMIMVYMGGHISGGHYNPAVTLAVFMRGKLPAKDVVPYWLAQLVGSILATFAVLHILGHGFAPTPSAGVVPSLLVELLFTFALALVVLNTATDDATAGNSFYGLAIGFTIAVAAAAGGPVSGGAFNPAVGLGPTLVSLIHGGSLSSVWLYLVGPLAGGALAAVVYKAQHPAT
jgi:aquaporin Z